MKNIFHKIYIHPLYYLVAFLSILTGTFKVFSIITIIFLVHEFGHVMASIMLKWDIDKIIVLPFGCLTKYNELLNRKIYEEAIILVCGPLIQIIFNYFYPTPYHEWILFFNLLPIYPLDGSKIVLLFLNKIISYYKSYIIVFIVSFITVFIFLYYNHDLIYIIMCAYLIIHLILHVLSIKVVFNKFLLERHLYSLKFNKTCIINSCNIKKMKRDYYHYFKSDNKLYNEKIILLKMFDK